MLDTRKFVGSAVFALAGLASSAANANLVVNGGFEADPIGNGGTGNGPPAGLFFDYVASLTGWTVNGGPNGIVLFNSGYRPVGGGLQSIQLEFPGNFIEQTIATVAGQQYVLTFDLASYMPPGISALEVEIGSDPALLFPDAGGGGYTTHAVQFTATSNSTLLHFESFGVAGAGATYPHLDDISVELVPEPGSLALVGAALAGLGMVRRRRNA